MKLILLGAPGAGKGTQAAVLSKALQIPAISTGNILRAAMKSGSELGNQAKAYVESGKLVPDELIIDVVRERINEADCANGFILDGVPRTIAQAEALEKAGVSFDAVVLLDVADDTIAKRMGERRVCESCGASYHLTNIPPKQEGVCDACGGKLVQRKDDTPETVLERLAIYHKETKPLEDFYAERGLLRVAEDLGSAEAITQKILEILGGEKP